MLVAAIIGLIGYPILVSRSYRPPTISSPEAPSNRFTIACGPTEVAVGTKSVDDHNEELCVPSNFPKLSQDEQIKVMSQRDSDFAQLQYSVQKEVVTVLVSRFYHPIEHQSAVSQTPRDSHVILLAAINGFIGGFPVGFAVWLFYGLVRFAVKG
jgi:hypothetical protein